MLRVDACERMQIARETLPALLELRRAGRARHVGVTGLPLGIFQKLLQQCDAAAPDIVLSYCHYCLNDSTLLDILPALEERGLGVINASCLSMGLLTHGGPPEWHPAPDELKAAARAAAACAASQGADISRLALMWAVKVRRFAPLATRPRADVGTQGVLRGCAQASAKVWGACVQA
jgi:L-galactose dehydrogenase